MYVSEYDRTTLHDGAAVGVGSGRVVLVVHGGGRRGVPVRRLVAVLERRLLLAVVVVVGIRRRRRRVGVAAVVAPASSAPVAVRGGGGGVAREAAAGPGPGPVSVGAGAGVEGAQLDDVGVADLPAQAGGEVVAVEPVADHPQQALVLPRQRHRLHPLHRRRHLHRLGGVALLRAPLHPDQYLRLHATTFTLAWLGMQLSLTKFTNNDHDGTNLTNCQLTLML